MRNANLHSSLRGWLLLAVGLLLATSAFADPQRYRWTGADSPNQNWDNPLNWEIEALPYGSGNWLPGTIIDGPPTSEDDAIFLDGAHVQHRTVHVAISPTNICRDMDWTGAVNMVFSGDPAATLEVFGACILAAPADLSFTFAGTIKFRNPGPAAKDITSAMQHFSCSLIFDGEGEWHLTDDFDLQYPANGVQNQGKVVFQANAHFGAHWTTNGYDSQLTFAANTTVTVDLDFNIYNNPANFSAAATDFVFPLNGGTFNGYGGHEVRDMIFQGGNSAVRRAKSNRKMECFGDASIMFDTECEDLILHGNGVFFDNSGSTIVECKNLTLSPGKIYSFYGTNVKIKSGGSLTADGGSCASVIVLQTTYDLDHGFLSEGVNLNINWATLYNVSAYATSGSPTFTATNSIMLSPASGYGWTLTNPPGQNAYWQGDADDQWFNPDNWSTGCVPNALDDVYFDFDDVAPSNTTCQIEGQQYAYCRSMIWQDWPVGSDPTVLDEAFSVAPYTLFVYGSMVFQHPGTNEFEGEVVFRKDLTDPTDRLPLVNKVVTSAGNHFLKSVRFHGHDDTYTLTDNSWFDNHLHHQDGFLVNPPGITLTINGPTGQNNLIGPGQGLDFHNSTIKWTNVGEFFCGYPLFNSTGSLVWLVQGGQVYGGGNTFHDVTFGLAGGNFYDGGTDNSGTVTFEANGHLQTGTFKNIHHAIFQADGFIENFYGFDQLDFAPGHYYQFSDGASIEIADDNSDGMAGFNASGADCEHYTYLMGLGPTAATITSDYDLNFQNVTMRNIHKGATSVNYDATGVKMENVTWNFSAQTARQLYWTAGSGDWFEADNWSEGSASGPLAACPPDWDDDVWFGWDADLDGQTVTASQSRLFCHDMDWSECTSNLPNPPHLNQTGKEINIYGSLAFTPGMNHPQGGEGQLTFWSNAPDEKIYCEGENIGYYAIFSGNGTWHFEDNFWAHILVHSSGTIITNSKNVTIDYVSYAGGNAEIFGGNSEFIHLQGNGGLNFGGYAAGKAHTQTSNFIFHNGGNLNGNGFDAVQDVTFIKLPPYDMHSASVSNIPLARNVKFLTGIIGSTLVNQGTITEKLLFEEDGTITGYDQFSTTITASTPFPPATAITPAADITLNLSPTLYIAEAEFKKNGIINSNTYFRDKLTLWGNNDYTVQAGKTVAIGPFGGLEINQLTGGNFAARIKSSDPASNVPPGGNPNFTVANMAHIYKDGEPLCADYLSLDNINHFGSAVFHDYPNSDNINNSNFGWDFTAACPPCPPETDNPPMLDLMASTIKVQAGAPVTLVLAGLPSGYEAVWFDETQTNELYSDPANSFTTTTYDASQLPVKFYGAIRDTSTGCLSPLVEVVICILPDVPTLTGDAALCPGESTVLSIAAGELYEATAWHWYEGSCGGTSIGTGTSVTVTPSVTTTYFVRGEGGCAMSDMASCGQITVTMDDQPPMLNCPADLTILTSSDGTGDCSAILLFTLPTATDNCGTATVISSIALGSNLPLGETTLILTATDANMNTATCTFTATVFDDEPPIVQCPDDMDIITCLAVTGIDPVSYVDNCTPLTINDISYTITGATTANGTGSASGTLFASGLSTVTYSATDWSGNVGFCSFSLDITPSTPVVNVVTNNPYCLYGDLTMTETGGDAVSWAWSGPFGFTSDVQSPVIHTAGPEWTNETFGVTITDANGCTNSQTFGYSDFIPPSSINTPANQTLCNGETTAPVNFTGGFPGTVYDWSMSTNIGLTPNFGTGNIPAFSAVNTTNAPIVATVTVIPLYYGCGGNAVTFTITVNPTPAIAASSNSPICDGEDLHFTESGGSASGWSWEGPNGWGSAVQNPSLPGATPAASGSYTVTVTDANGCTNSQTLAVTVNPGIEIDPVADITVCHGQPTGDIVFGPAGNLFDWTIDNAAIGAGAGAAGVPQIPSFIAVNPSSLAPTVATVSVLPAAGSCSGLPETFTVTVNPIPTVNPVPNLTVCAGELVNVPFGGVVGGTTFNWSYTTVPAGKDIGLPSSGMGDLNFTAMNTTSANIIATFTVMPMFGDCPCTNLTFTITVKPTPQVMTTLTDKTFCSTGKSVLAQTLTANMPGTVITWVNTSSPTVILPASGGNVIPAYTPTNTGTTPLVATIVVTATKNGCSSSKSFTITVNPVPTLAAVPNQTACHGELKTITLTSNLPSPPTSFIWTSSNATTGLTAGTFAAPDRTFTALNTGTANKITNVTVKGTANGCNGPAVSFSLTVKPTPNVAQPVNREKCHGEMSGNITFSTAPAMLGVTYSWSVAPSATALAIGMPAASGTGAIPSFSVVNSGIAPVTVTVTVAATKNGCAGPARTFTIKAKPTPVLDAMPAPTVCAGATVSIPLSSPVAGTTFTWQNTNPAIGLSAGPVLGSIPNFTATNGGTAQITGIITVTPAANGCTGPVATTLVNVNPAATVNQPGDQTVESGDAVEVIFTGTPGSTIYNWTQTAGPDIGLGTVPVSGTGNLSFTADNPATVDIIGTFEVTPVSSGGCVGATKTFSITVQPMSPLPPPPTADREAGTDPCDAANSTEPGAALGFLLHQNYPNPFWEETTVSFCLPKEMPATLTVWDMAGRLLYRDIRDFPAGENAILLTANDLGATRALVCRLETPLGTATRQMIRVE